MFTWTVVTMHLKYANMLVIVVPENMKLGHNTLNNERLTIVNTKRLPKYLWIVTLISLPYNISIILKLKGHIKGGLISRILNFLKNLSSALKIIRQFVKVDQNVKKTANTSASIHTNQILLSSNRLELSPWSLTQVFKKIETTIRWNRMSKALRFLQITAEHQDCPFFTVFLTTKSLSQNISITLLQISLKLKDHEAAIGGKN